MSPLSDKDFDSSRTSMEANLFLPAFSPSCEKTHGEHGELARANRELHPNDFRYFCEPP